MSDNYTGWRENLALSLILVLGIISMALLVKGLSQ